MAKRKSRKKKSGLFKGSLDKKIPSFNIHKKQGKKLTRRTGVFMI